MLAWSNDKLIIGKPHSIKCAYPPSQEVLDEDMPDLPEYKAPEDSDISIELQFPIAGAEVSILDILY